MTKKIALNRQSRRTTDRHDVFLFFAPTHFLKTILWLTRIWHIGFCPTHKADASQKPKSQIFPCSVWVLSILTMLFSIDSFGQIQYPQTPQFPNSPQTPTTPNYPMGATANDIIEQTYRMAEQRMGAYINRPYLTPEQNRKAAQQYQMQQIQKQPGYGNPTTQNNFNQMTPQMKLEREMIELLKENQYYNSLTSEKEYYNSPYYLNDLPN
jgi:hypothetical protein